MDQSILKASDSRTVMNTGQVSFPPHHAKLRRARIQGAEVALQIIALFPSEPGMTRGQDHGESEREEDA